MIADYAQSLRDVDSKMVAVTDNDRVIRQLRVTGASDAIGQDNVYRSTVFIGETVRAAHDDAIRWVQQQQQGSAS